MAEIVLQFKFDSFEEQEELKVQMRASMSYGVLWDIDQELRNILKHGDHEWLRDEGVQDYLQKVRDYIHESGVFLDG